MQLREGKQPLSQHHLCSGLSQSWSWVGMAALRGDKDQDNFIMADLVLHQQKI